MAYCFLFYPLLALLPFFLGNKHRGKQQTAKQRSSLTRTSGLTLTKSHNHYLPIFFCLALATPLLLLLLFRSHFHRQQPISMRCSLAGWQGTKRGFSLAEVLQIHFAIKLSFSRYQVLSLVLLLLLLLHAACFPSVKA